jgi:Icc protein
MTRIAHLTDLHLLEDGCHQRSGVARYRLGFLSAGVTWDAAGRRERAQRQLARARALRVDHVLITGDLTEDGLPEQFEDLAHVLNASGFAPEQVTLVPGNHDAYTGYDAFARALEGPLKPYRKTSAPGAVTVLDEVVIKPLSTVIPNQSFTMAAGHSSFSDVRELARLCRSPVVRKRALVVAQHHPAFGIRNPVMNRIEGTLNTEPMRELLASEHHVHVVHGHTHQLSALQLEERSHPQVLCATASRDDGESLRVYTAADQRLHTHEDSAVPERGFVESFRKLIGVYQAA